MQLSLAWHVAAVQQEVEAQIKAEDELKPRASFCNKNIELKVIWSWTLCWIPSWLCYDFMCVDYDNCILL